MTLKITHWHLLGVIVSVCGMIYFSQMQMEMLHERVSENAKKAQNNLNEIENFKNTLFSAHALQDRIEVLESRLKELEAIKGASK